MGKMLFGPSEIFLLQFLEWPLENKLVMRPCFLSSSQFLWYTHGPYLGAELLQVLVSLLELLDVAPHLLLQLLPVQLRPADTNTVRPPPPLSHVPTLGRRHCRSQSLTSGRGGRPLPSPASPCGSATPLSPAGAAAAAAR